MDGWMTNLRHAIRWPKVFWWSLALLDFGAVVAWSGGGFTYVLGVVAELPRLGYVAWSPA